MDIQHHSHYNLDKLSPCLKSFVNNNVDLLMPMFVGQGWSMKVGSDIYGGYIVSIGILPNGKPIVGLVDADTQMFTSWEDGCEKCALPDNASDPSHCKPTSFVTTYGKQPNGIPKWWFCNSKGIRSIKCNHSWNGAASYRCPSF